MARQSTMTTHGAITQLSAQAKHAYEAAQSIKWNLRALYDTAGLTEDTVTAEIVASQLGKMAEAMQHLMQVSEATFDAAKAHMAKHQVMKPATIKKVSRLGTEIIEIGKGKSRAQK